MKPLLKGYTAEIDTLQGGDWNNLLNAFEDANIYQTWAYNEIRSGAERASTFILKYNGKIVATAIVRLFPVPLLKAGIAYVYWGPMWRPKGIDADPAIFAQAIRALRNEYTCRRGLILRIFPLLFDDEDNQCLPLLSNEGYLLNKKDRAGRTLIIDLTGDLAILRKGLEQKWRNCLNRAQRNELDIIEGCDDEMYEDFIAVYRQMLDRKQFMEPNDINEFRAVQKLLPDAMKMRIMLCRQDGKTAAGAIFSAIGNSGIYLFGAINEIGMKTNASYLFQWRFIEWLKENHFVFYNLNGINPEANPGTYRFKAGLCGKNGKDVYYSGKFDTCKTSAHRIALRFFESFMAKYKRYKSIATNKHSND
jgi:hypothetical protein